MATQAKQQAKEYNDKQNKQKNVFYQPEVFLEQLIKQLRDKAGASHAVHLANKIRKALLQQIKDITMLTRLPPLPSPAKF